MPNNSTATASSVIEPVEPVAPVTPAEPVEPAVAEPDPAARPPSPRSTAIQYPGQVKVAGRAMGTRPAPRLASQLRHRATAPARSASGSGSCSIGVCVADARQAAKERTVSPVGSVAALPTGSGSGISIMGVSVARVAVFEEVASAADRRACDCRRR